MKRKLLVGTLIGVMMITALAGCGKKTTPTEDTEKTEVQETTESAETDVEKEEAAAEEPVEVETHVVDGLEITIPAEDNHYVEMMEDAGLIEKGKFTGSWVRELSNDEVAVCMNAENPQLYFGYEDEATCTEDEINQFIADVNTQLNKINSGSLAAVDFNGDGTITNSEKFIVSIFTTGTTYEGIYTHVMN